MSVVPPFTADLYDRLGLGPTTDARAIRRRFRQLVRLYHPDRNPAPTAHERFLALQAAYDILNDPATRARYDRWLAEQGPAARPLALEVRLGPMSLRTRETRQRLYLLASLEATLDQAALEAPLNLVLVLDHSSSMRGERVEQSKRAVYAIAERLQPRDTFAIVGFNDRASVVLAARSAPPLEIVRSVVETLETSGGTEIASGLELGLEQLGGHKRAGVLSHLILLTDGQTYGDEARALALADQAGAEQVGLTALGIGNDWNDTFLDELAARAHGRAWHVRRPAEAVAIFEHHLRQLQRTIARSATLTFEPGPQVEVLAWHEVAPELRRLVPDEQTAALGPLTAGSPLRVLLDLVVSPADQDILLAGDLSLQADLRQNQQTAAIQQPVVASLQSATGEMPGEIVAAAQRVAMLRIQERAWQAVAAGNVAAARRDLALLAARLSEMGEAELAFAARRELETVAMTGRLSAGGSKVIKYGSRGLGLPPLPQRRP